ncbi:MFS transporter [Aerococcaceae bacterium DSM 111022]|nr:MFS transporter [Aerococcaceae bacterium DSM 111022]
MTTSKLFTKDFILVMFFGFFLFISMNALTTVLPTHITNVLDDPVIGGMTTTVFMFAAILTRPLVGYFIQKVNINILNTVSILLFAVLIFALQFTTIIPIVMTLRALQGVLFGILSTTVATLATSIVPANRRGEGVGIYGASQSTGGALAPVIGLPLLQNFSYQTFITAVSVAAFIGFIVSLLTRKPEKKVEEVTADPTEKVSFWDYAFDKRALLPCAIVLFVSFPLGGVNTFMGPLAAEVGLSEHVSLFFLAQAIFNLVFKTNAGKIMDNHGHLVVVYPAIGLGILGFLILTRLNSLPLFILSGALIGAAIGSLSIVFQTLALNSLSDDKHATANAMYFSFMDFGIAISASILGMVANAFNFKAVFVVAAISLVLMFIVYFSTLGKNKAQEKVTES